MSEYRVPAKYHRDDHELIRLGKQKIAMTRVSQAIANGTLVRRPECQICGKACKTVAHHHRGYDYPFDVWFICSRCNYHLDVHDGSLTLEKARAYVRRKYASQFSKRLGWSNAVGRRSEDCEVCGLEARFSDMVCLPISEDEDIHLCPRCGEKALAEVVTP